MAVNGVDDLEWYCPGCSEAFPDRVTLRYHQSVDHGSAPLLEAEYPQVPARPYVNVLLPESAS